MDSAIVIKVKHGETLRRFNAHVVDGELDLDMDGLKEKILGLFKFTPDTELTLTYVDEDNDIVTIGDDEDLLDVVRQGLNPLRITVKLNAEGSDGQAYSRSSGGSTPLRSPQVQQPLPNFNSNVLEFFKSVPEPIRKKITNLCADVASTGTASSPSISEVVQFFAEAGLPYLKLLSEFQAAPAGSDTTPQDGPPESPAGPDTPSQGWAPGSTNTEIASHGSDGSKVCGVSSDVLSDGKSEMQTSKSNEEFRNIKSEATLEAGEKTSGNVTAVSKASTVQIPGFESLKAALESLNVSDSSKGTVFTSPEAKPPTSSKIDSGKKRGDSLMKGVVFTSPISSKIESGKKKKAYKSTECIQGVQSVNSLLVDAAPVLNVSGDREGHEKCNISTAPKSINDNVVPLTFGPAKGKWCSPDSQPVYASAEAKNVFGNNLGSGPNSVPSPTNECPFTGIPLGNSSATALQPPSCVIQSSEYTGHRDSLGIIFHRGVRCDGCGVHPITGPRYKSKVKEDYDLCSICFSQMGIESDYIRMDRPITYRHPLSFKGFYDFPNRAPPPQRHVNGGCGLKPLRHKLDSRFIQDVNILDGTLMAPSVSFTKIWRMRNNGSVVWPQGTQLVWIGGDRLTDTFSVELEIAAAGLPVDQELDIAVDFTAPDRPGRYISYWRMASPSGQKFGQRVWVLVQVDASIKESPRSFRGFNLNLPPVMHGVSGPEIINVNPEPIMEDPLSLLSELGKSNTTTELVEPIVDVASKKEQEVNFPINDSLLVGGAATNTGPAVPSASVSYPIVDLSEAASAPSPVSVVRTSTEDVREQADVEETLLKDLEEMGFKQVDLNKEILRLNEYDLEKSVDDLCGVSEWDPILEDLREMGFCDEEMNKNLLKKNNGSIKRVVLDLLAKEKM